MPAPAQTIADAVNILGIMGRNGSDSRLAVPENQCLEARNVDWFQSSLARRRGGSKAIGMAGGTAFANGCQSLYRFVPSDDESAAEFWAVDGSFIVHRLTGGVNWADVATVQDPPTASADKVVMWGFNGKLYAAFKNAHNRLHVWDGTTWRRVGLDLPAAPTTGALVGGAVTDTRKYRVSYAVYSGTTLLRRSNLGPASASVAPVAQQVPVTKPAAINEGETHWELWAASTTSAFADYRLLATTVVGTATVNDNNASLPATVAPADGANTPPPSAKYVVSDDARLIMGGAWETNAENAMAPSPRRIWWSSLVSDVSNVGNDERISNTGAINSYADLDEAVTGISPPMQVSETGATTLQVGTFYAFSYRSHYRFSQTGVAAAPYSKFKIQGGRGCISHKSIVVAEDANGNPTIYWASPEGFYRINPNGQQFCGEDLFDIWPTVNLDATVPCFGKFYPDLKQIWYYIATGASNFPNFRCVFDTRLGRFTETSGVRLGWSTADGESAKAYCAEMFSDSIAASMGRRLKPHIGYTGANQVWKCDTTDQDDNGNLFQAYLDTKSYAPWGLDKQGGMSRDAMLFAAAAAGQKVTLTAYWREGADSEISDADLTPPSDSGLETHVTPLFEGSKTSDTTTLRFRIGDDQAKLASWNLSALSVPITLQGDR